MLKFLLVFLISVVTNAKTMDLSDVDDFLKNETFANSFQPNDTATIKVKSCLSPGPCDEYVITNKVTDASETQATVVDIKPDGTLASQDQITSDTWEQNHRNMIRILIANITSYGVKTTIDAIEIGSITVQVSGSSKTVETRIVTLHTETAIGPSMFYKIAVAPGLGGIGQIVSQSKTTNYSLDSSDLMDFTRK